MATTSFAARSVRERWPDVTEMDGFFQTPTMDTEGGQQGQPRARTARRVWYDEARPRSGQEHGSGSDVIPSAMQSLPE